MACEGRELLTCVSSSTIVFCAPIRFLSRLWCAVQDKFGLLAKKIAPVDVIECLLNAYPTAAVTANAVRQRTHVYMHTEHALTHFISSSSSPRCALLQDGLTPIRLALLKGAAPATIEALATKHPLAATTITRPDEVCSAPCSHTLASPQAGHSIAHQHQHQHP